MDTKEIENIVSECLSHSIQGLSKEQPKFDFKRQWYDLKDIKDINEFLKDACAIANTSGGDGFIVMGFDEKKNLFQPAMFSDSGLKDTSDLNGIIRSRVDPEFEMNILDIMYEDHPISVLHIPESANKPHVIRQFIRSSKAEKEGRAEEHRIFIRKNTSVNCASRQDLDRMYRERYEAIEPDLDLNLSIQRASVSLLINEEDDRLLLQCNLYVENYGRKTALIREIIMNVLIPDQYTNQDEIITFYHRPDSTSIRVEKKFSFIAVFLSKSERKFHNDIERRRFRDSYSQITGKLSFQDGRLILSNGTEMKVDVSLF